MARRREFKGIVKNLAKLYSGRNNDFLGYWSVGQLFLLAQELGVDSFTFDLINFKSGIDSPELVDMRQSMMFELKRVLYAHRIPIGWIKSASVTFSFNQDYQKNITIGVRHLGNHTWYM